MKPIIVEETRAITVRADGLAFQPDLRPGWLRCAACSELVAAGKSAMERHDCKARYWEKEKAG